MNAAQAERLSRRGVRLKEQQRRAEAKKAAQQERENMRYQKSLVPKHMKAIYAKIKEAADNGQRRATWYLNWSLDREVRDIIEARLNKKKFSVEFETRSGEDIDEGFRHHWSSTEAVITWGSQRG